MTDDLDQIRVREAAALMHTYGRRQAAFARGSGVWLYDGDGRAHLDALSGLAVTALGHAHPEVTAAVSEQAATLSHTSNLYFTRPQIELAEGLADTLGWSDARTFFCNSGAEANEAAIKLARLHGRRRRPDAIGVVALSGGFHGRTLGALKATGNPAKHEPFEPLGDWVTHVAHDEAAGPRPVARACGAQERGLPHERREGVAAKRPRHPVQAGVGNPRTARPHLCRRGLPCILGRPAHRSATWGRRTRLRAVRPLP